MAPQSLLSLYAAIALPTANRAGLGHVVALVLPGAASLFASLVVLGLVSLLVSQPVRWRS